MVNEMVDERTYILNGELVDGIDIPLGEEVELSSTKLVQEEPPLLDGLTINPVTDVKVKGASGDMEVYAITCKNGELPNEIRFVVPQTDYNLDPENIVKPAYDLSWTEERTKPLVEQSPPLQFSKVTSTTKAVSNKKPLTPQEIPYVLQKKPVHAGKSATSLLKPYSAKMVDKIKYK